MGSKAGQEQRGCAQGGDVSWLHPCPIIPKKHGSMLPISPPNTGRAKGMRVLIHGWHIQFMGRWKPAGEKAVVPRGLLLLGCDVDGESPGQLWQLPAPGISHR